MDFIWDVLGIVGYAIGFAVYLVLLFVSGWMSIAQCYGDGAGLHEFTPRHLTCDFANTAIGLYAVVFGLVVAYEVYAIWTKVNYDKLFGWFYSGKHPATDVVKRSGRDIAGEFAGVLEAQYLDDVRARALFGQLGPIRQAMWRARYRERLKAAKQLREMLDAQTAAWNADSDLGGSVLRRERTYRAGRHR